MSWINHYFNYRVIQYIVFFEFLENAIDSEAFLLLKENVIKELIPVIGDRSKFSKKYETYLSNAKETLDILNSTSQIEFVLDATKMDLVNGEPLGSPDVQVLMRENHLSTAKQNDLPMINLINKHNNYIKNILQTTIRGKEILYELKTLNTLNYNKLTAIIIDKTLEENVEKR